MKKKFVPDDFEAPGILETETFRLRMLSVNDVEKDYDAVMSSKETLRKVFATQTEWPKDDMTLDENLQDLERHQQEFLDRKAFAYTVVTLDETRCLGCVYVYPFPSVYDAVVFLWARDSELGLDEELFKTVKDWVNTKWPFEKVAFPGRDLSWDAWEGIVAELKKTDK